LDGSTSVAGSGVQVIPADEPRGDRLAQAVGAGRRQYRVGQVARERVADERRRVVLRLAIDSESG
jgi:hypothetical protein